MPRLVSPPGICLLSTFNKLYPFIFYRHYTMAEYAFFVQKSGQVEEGYGFSRPLIKLNVADCVCIYFYNFNHENFYQGIQKFTYSTMNMLRLQNNRIKWILCIISLGFGVFYFITLWESLRDNLLVHRPRPIHYSYNRQQLLNIYSTVRSVSSYNTISKTCMRKLRVYRLNKRRKMRRGKRGTGNKWNKMFQYQHLSTSFHARMGIEKENLIKINTNINR